MKWILTENNVLVNVETISTMYVQKRKKHASIETSDGETAYGEIPFWKVVAELNYYDGEGGDYVCLTNDMRSEEEANEFFKEIINWLTESKDNAALAIKTDLVQGVPINVNVNIKENKI